MSKFTNVQENRMGYRWQLLVTVSAIALLGSAYGAGNAQAADSDSDRPQLWIELGGQYDALVGGGQQPYAPPFLSLLPATLPSPLPAQNSPGGSFDWNGKVSFQPEGSDWVFSASIRYGRASSSGHRQKDLKPGTYVRSRGAYTYINTADAADYVRSDSNDTETHAILDFMAGKDVGIGLFGESSVLSGGVRVAQFTSNRMASINADPDYVFRVNHDFFSGTEQAKRSFHGVGPTVAWDASVPIAGNEHDGQVTFDWGANAAVLFGRRKVDIHHHTSECGGVYQGQTCVAGYNTHGTIPRSRQTTVPNLGGFAAISMRYGNAKVSFGYRADEFFGAMDGGIDTAKKENVGFYGPFASVSVGIGG